MLASGFCDSSGVGVGVWIVLASGFCDSSVSFVPHV